jgi:hypothetical protein
VVNARDAGTSDVVDLCQDIKDLTYFYNQDLDDRFSWGDND